MVMMRWLRFSGRRRVLLALVRIQLMLAPARAESAAPEKETWPTRCVYLGTTLAGLSTLVLLAALRRHR